MNVNIRTYTTQDIIDRWDALAERRYGDKSQESLDRIAEDACSWLLDRWDNGRYTIYDWFWANVALYYPFKRFAAIGWAKLVFERYLAY